MPQQDGSAVIKDLTDVPKNAYHALTHAFGLDDEGDDPKKKKAVPFPGPTMTDEANKSFADDPSHRSPAAGGPLDKMEDKFKDAKPLEKMKPIKQGFMSKAMAKKPAPAPAPSPMAAARNRYGSTQKRKNGGY